MPPGWMPGAVALSAPPSARHCPHDMWNNVVLAWLSNNALDDLKITITINYANSRIRIAKSNITLPDAILPLRSLGFGGG